MGVSYPSGRITCGWTALVSGPARPGWQRAGLAGAPDALGALGALVSPPAGSGAPGGEQAGPLSDDAAVLAELPPPLRLVYRLAWRPRYAKISRW